MDRLEFIDELRESLASELPVHEIDSHIAYYNDYIINESKINTEIDVIKQLGEARLIAKTIIDTYKIGKGSDKGFQSEQIYEEVYESSNGTNSKNRRQEKEFKSLQFGWYHKLVLVLLIIVVLSLIIFIGGIVLNLFINFGVPILMIFVVYKFISKIFRKD